MGAMRIDEIYAAGDRPVFSFEFFPPKTPEGEANLYLALASLRSLSPDFVSVTYGAGGSTRGKTLEIVSRIRDEIGLEAMAHFTCVGATVDELRSTLDDMSRLGFENVLALRGDPPQGQEEWTKTEGGLEYSRELVELISADYQLSIGAACFPETHIHATSAEDDLRYLKEKVDAGVSFLITQLFFDNALYYDFVARARAIGIEVPIVPGHPAHHDLQPALARDEHVRRDDPRPRAHRPAPAQGERRGGGRVRRGLRDDAVRRPAGQRRARDPLLHAQPLPGDARDPQRAAPLAPVGPRAHRPRRAPPPADARQREESPSSARLAASRRPDRCPGSPGAGATPP